MFLKLLLLEYKYLFKRISTYIYGFVFFLMGYLIMNAFAGAVTGVRVQVINSGAEQAFTNSSVNIMMISGSLNLLLILFIGGYLSDILLKDYSHKSFQLVYTKSVNKHTLLLSRLFVSLTMVIFLFFFVQLGLIAGRFSPWLDTKQFQSFNFLYYLNPFIKLSVTNILITSSVYTLVAISSRKKLYVNMSAVIMYLIYTAVISFSSRLEFKEMSAIFDIFGLSAVSLMIENWTIAQRNTNLLSFSSYFLYNRIFWFVIAGIIYSIAFRMYKFEYHLAHSRHNKVSSKQVEKPSYIHYGVISIKWNILTYFKQLFYYLNVELKTLIRSVGFKVFVLIYIIIIIASLSNYGVIYDTNVQAVTYLVTENLRSVVLGFCLIFIAIFSSELVWKSRTSKCEYFEDSSPLNSSQKVISHICTLLITITILWIIATFIGVGYQIFHSYHQIDFSLYLMNGLLVLIPIFMYASLAVLIQSIMPNRLSGVIVFFILITVFDYIPYIGLEHPLFQVFNLPSVIYSDMNKFGNFLPKYFVFASYWLSFSLIIILITNKIYRNGLELSLLKRLKRIFSHWSIREHTFLAFFILTFVASGAYVYYNENILNDFKTNKKTREYQVAFEQNYKYLEEINQPRVTDVDLNVQIYPESLDLGVSGQLLLQNKSGLPIDTLLFFVHDPQNNFEFTVDYDYETIVYDQNYDLFLIKLNQSLLPGDFLTYTFENFYEHRGYEVSTNVCENGTFFNSSLIMPEFGYASNFELQSNEIRQKYGLPAKERMAENDDLKARSNHYISHDSDWVNFSATVGTSKDQIAVAPGYLVDSWIEGNRKLFRYEMDHPILKFFSFSSARYQIKSDTWTSARGKDVKLEIYHHPGHEYNLDSMMKALKMGLTHYSDNFMEYPHKQMRILEFPRYATFAQSFPNTVPFSEGIGFIAKVDENSDNNYPFFVTAHELAHQWWAHVVIGADVKGAVLMSEALAQYSALSVMEEEYGEIKLGNFIRHELHSYLTGRSSETSKEMSLAEVENQQYIHYNKGSVVMMGLKKYLGADKINRALERVVNKYGYQEAPYLNSSEFLTELYTEVPDSLETMVKEMFEDIVLYSNEIKEAEATNLGSAYEVNLVVDSSKIQSDEKGNEEMIPMDEWVEVLVFSKKNIQGREETVIANPDNRWFKIKTGENKISLLVNEIPLRAGVDPHFNLLDKNIYDNEMKVDLKN